MFYVYGMQAQGDPTGNVKIGYSKKPPDRLGPLELGALGARLHIIFMAEAGDTHQEGRAAERAYHNQFAHLRVNRESFRFDPTMLTWRPDKITSIDRDTYRSFAENTKMIDIRRLAGVILDTTTKPEKQSRPINSISILPIVPYVDLQSIKRTKWD